MHNKRFNVLNESRESLDIKIAVRSFENGTQFSYLGKTVTIQNVIQEEIKSILNSVNAYYNSVQNKTKILHVVVLYGFEI
jgi:hypothetical protein